MIQGRTVALLVLTFFSAAILGGCETFSRPGQPSSAARGQPVAATGLARALEPAAAATAAVHAACKRLGAEQPAAVLFFECFPDAADGIVVAKTIQSLCPKAEVVGCSAGGVATGEGWSADRAIAAVAIAGPGLRVSTAYAPPSFASSKAAGQWLAGQLEPGSGEAVTVLLTTPATVARETWDANSLVRSLAERRGGTTQIAGGLAGGDQPRVYHAGRTFSGGVAAVCLSGQIEYGSGSAHELLRIGPAWRIHNGDGRTVRQLTDGQTTRSAGQIVTSWLLAQDRPWGCLGLLAENQAIPLRFGLADDGSVSLPVAVNATDRFVLLRPAMARAAEQAVDQAIGLADLHAPASARDNAGPLTLLAAPDSRDRDEMLAMVHDRLRRATRHPAAVAFISTGQFVSLPGGQHLFASHLFTALHVVSR